MTDPNTAGGLRARKRAATQATIERAAVALALEHGYDHVTVEMICDASMVSPRTFFNYFGTKEGVILGAIPALPADADVDAFVHGTGASVLEDFLALISRTMTDHAHANDHDLLRARRTLIQRTPELALKEQSRITEHETRYIAIILDRFRAEERAPLPGSSLEDEARMMITLATAMIHHMAAKWPTELPTPRQSARLVRDSVALIRRLASSAPGPAQ